MPCQKQLVKPVLFLLLTPGIMKFLKYFSGTIAVVFVVVFLGSLVLPKTYYLERSIEIDAPVVNVFPLVGELRNWSEWSSWYEMDPELKVTYGAKTTGLGGSYSWTGEKAGTGTITISEFDPPTKVAFKLVFKGWENSPSASSFTLTTSETKTDCKVTWVFSGEFHGNPIQRYFGLMFEKLVGGEYEKSLANLKALVEAK